MKTYHICTADKAMYAHRGERAEARAIAEYIANTHRVPIWISATRCAPENIFPRETTRAEFIGLVRRAMGGDYLSELWLRHAYKGTRRVYEAIGYFKATYPRSAA